MATQPTQNAVPSESPRDLKFNAGKIDEFVTSLQNKYIDRFGGQHFTIEGMRWLAQQAISAFGYITVDSFQVGATLTLPNQILRDTTSGEYYRWDGSFPKVVASGSTPVSTGGVGAGKWLSVGSAALASVQNGAGDALVAVVKQFVGAAARTLHDVNEEKPFSITDASGVIGDGTTDCTIGVNQVISGTGEIGNVFVPSRTDREAAKYKVSSINNPYGVRLKGPGQVVIPQSVGGIKTAQYPIDDSLTVLGKEYMYRAMQQLVPGQGDVNGTLRIVLFGDSTIAGRNGESAPYFPETYLSNQFAKIGLPNVQITNAGVGGSNIQAWDPSAYLTDSYDMFIVSYGINDGGTGRPDRLEQFVTKLRSTLQTIRANANGALTKKTIVFKMSNSTNDTPNNRDAYWYIQLRNVIIQACRDYQCVFFDTFSQMPDSYGLAGTMLDNPFSNGIGVHPMDRMVSLVWGGLIDSLFSKSQIAPYTSNNFIVSGAVSGNPLAGTVATSYQYGLNVYRATTTDGWPLDGVAVTMRHVDSPTRQTLYGYGTSSKSMNRTWNIATTTWNEWTGRAVGLTPANGWAAAVAPDARISEDGKVTITAYLTGGTTASGTQILTGLPTTFRPAAERRFAIANDAGTITCVGVSATGNIFLVGAATNAAGVHVNVSYYAA